MKIKLIGLSLIFFTSITAQIHDNPYEVKIDPKEKITFKNPVIPGFYSDPSVCKVGEDFYLVTSTFEYFPGVPVFHSKDLVNWEQIGHCIDRAEQLPKGINIFAPTIRYHKGTFYMITTNVVDGGNFYVTATHPAGPWSDPIWTEIPGIDPDLFFDEDGKTYVISSQFELFEIDLKSGKLLTPGKKVWYGTGGRYIEGPHIYKKDGFYYLMNSEGGTEEAHSVNIARSNNIWGPYAENPSNPILTHANAAGQNKSIQGVGHADLIQANDDSWWMVFHGYRKSVGYPVHHILGRETCLAPVSWPKYGWPVINGNGTVSENMTSQTLPLKPFKEEPFKDDFDQGKLGLKWNFIRPPAKRNPYFDLKDGHLILTGTSKEIGSQESPAFVGRRLQHINFKASTELEFDPKNPNEHAGMALVNNGMHFDILVKNDGKNRTVFAELHFGSITYRSKEFELKSGPVILEIEGKGENFLFSYNQNGIPTLVEKVDSRYLSTETVGWFTGIYVGLYATGMGKDCEAPAKFTYFDYRSTQ